MNYKRWIRNSYIGLVYLFLYLPIALLVVFSFNQSKYSLVWHGFSLKWFDALWTDTNLWVALYHSILLGACAGFLATVIALLASLQLFLFHKKKLKRLMNYLVVLIIIPDLVVGISLLILFNFLPLSLGFWSLLIAHITFCLPFALLALNTQFEGLDRNIYFAAIDLGASRFQAMLHIIIPAMWSGILSALLLSFTLSFDDVIISYFVAGPDYPILPLTIFSMVRSGVSPVINALCSITFLISMSLVVFAYRLSRNVP